jgi:hypothetical protein
MRNHSSLIAGMAGMLVVAVAAGCGKKGPPLPPLNPVPVAPEQFKVRRLGSAVFLQFKIPSANRDGTKPADLARVDVYGYTGVPASLADVLENGTLVARVPVRRPPEPDQETKDKKGKKGTRGQGKKRAANGTRDTGQAQAENAAAAGPGKGGQAGGQAEAGQPAQAGGQATAGAGSPIPRPAPRPVKKRAAPEPGFDQGAVVTVTEEISPSVLRPVVPKPRRRRAAPARPAETAPPLWSDPSAVPLRVYVAVPFNHHGKPGAPTPQRFVPLVTGADAPSASKVGYDEQSVTLSWEAPPNRWQPVQEATLTTNLASAPLGMTWCHPVQDPAAGENLPSRSLARGCDPVQWPDPIQTLASTAKPAASVPTRYNVYAVGAASAGTLGAPPGGLPAFEMPVPLNEKPLDAPTFSEKRGEYGVERCYVVRAVDTFGGGEVESRAAAPVCVTPKDIFPPAAPTGLGAVAGGGAINLIWEPNTEPDLAGYLVLRGEAPGEDLRPLTPDPITETTFRDSSVKPGVRYVYAVVAVDKADPRNVSGQSNKVEETAR